MQGRLIEALDDRKDTHLIDMPGVGAQFGRKELDAQIRELRERLERLK